MNLKHSSLEVEHFGDIKLNGHLPVSVSRLDQGSTADQAKGQQGQLWGRLETRVRALDSPTKSPGHGTKIRELYLFCGSVVTLCQGFTVEFLIIYKDNRQYCPFTLVVADVLGTNSCTVGLGGLAVMMA